MASGPNIIKHLLHLSLGQTNHPTTLEKPHPVMRVRRLLRLSKRHRILISNLTQTSIITISDSEETTNRNA